MKNTRLAPAESWGQLSFVCYGNGESALAGRFNFSVLSYLHYICVRGWDLLSDISARTSLYWVPSSACWVPNCSSHTHILKNDPSVRSFVNTAQKMWVHTFGFQKSSGKRTVLRLPGFIPLGIQTSDDHHKKIKGKSGLSLELAVAICSHFPL